MDREFSPAEPDALHHTHPVHELMTDLVTGAELLEAEAESSQEVNTPFPQGFQGSYRRAGFARDRRRRKRMKPN